MFKRILLILLAAGLACLILLGAAAFLVGRHLGSDEFRADLSQTLSKALGRDVALEGRLRIRVFPWLGVRTGPLRIGNPEGFAGPPLLDAAEVYGGVRLLPLFSGRILLDTVTLKDITLRLERDAAGRTNYSDLLELLRAKAGQADAEASGLDLSGLRLRGLDVSNASIEYADAKENRHCRLAGVRLHTGRFEPGKPLAFSLEGDFDFKTLDLDARLKLSGRLHTDLERRDGLFSETALHASVGGRFLPAGERLECVADVSFDAGNSTLGLTDAHIKAAGLHAVGRVEVRDLFGNATLDGRIEARPFHPGRLINAYFPGAVREAKAEGLKTAAFSGLLSVSAGGGALSDLSLSLDGATFRGALFVEGFEAPRLRLELKGDSLDFDRYLPFVRTEEDFFVSDLLPNVFKALSAEAHVQLGVFKCEGDRLEGVDLALRSGGGETVADLRQARLGGGRLKALAWYFANPAAPREQPEIALSVSASLEGVEARSLPLCASPERVLTGRASGFLRAEMARSPLALKAPLSEVLRRASLTLGLAVADGALEFKPRPAAKGEKPEPVRLDFSEAKLGLRATPGRSAPDGDYPFEARFEASLARRKQPYEFSAKLAGPLVVDRRLKGVRLADAALDVSLKEGFLPKKEQAVLSAKASLDSVRETAALKGIGLAVFGQKLRGSLTASKVFGEHVSAGGRIEMSGFDPKRVLSLFDWKPPVARDKAAWRKLAADLDVNATSRGLGFGVRSLTLDDAVLSGRVDMAGFVHPRFSLNVQVGVLDLDRYLPPDDGTSSCNGGKPAERKPGDPLPLEDLRRLAVDGGVFIRELKFQDLRFRDVVLPVHAADGLIELKNVTAQSYGGRLRGHLQLQAETRQLKLFLDLEQRGFSAGPFMRDLVRQEYVRGLADLWFVFQSHGATDRDIVANLSGSAGLEVRDGSYILSKVEEADPRKARAGQPEKPRKSRTPFRKAHAGFKVERGAFGTEDFRLESPSVTVTGKGGFSLPDNTIGLNLTADFPGTPDVPIKIYGCLSDPEAEIPAGKLINNTVMEILGLPMEILDLPRRTFRFLQDVFQRKPLR
jgi:AsmA protein